MTELKRTIRYYPIHSKVLIVLVTRAEGTWKAYVTPVPGINHDEEAPLFWERDGVQLSEAQARVFFPYMEDVPYAH